MLEVEKKFFIIFDNIAEKLVSISVIIWMFAFFLFAFRVKNIVGHWPYYAHPDPKNVELDFHYFLVLIGFYFLFLLIFSKFLSSIFVKLHLLKAILYIVPIGSAIVIFSGEYGGAMMVGSGFLFLIVSILLIGHHIISKKINLYSSIIQISLIIFWVHIIIDPFSLINWFLD